jgi:hypothetical protein
MVASEDYKFELIINDTLKYNDNKTWLIYEALI